MRAKLRFFTSLLIVIFAVAFLSAFLQSRFHNHYFTGWRHTFVVALLQMLLVVGATIFLNRLSTVGLVNRMADWMRQLRTGASDDPLPFPSALFDPIKREAATFAKHLSDAVAAADEEASLRRKAESLWTPQRLKEYVRNKLSGRPLLVISNREPYAHLRRGGQIEMIVPAGGLVTALDPVLRAAGGTWIAHGSGDADKVMLDDQNKIKVPPQDPHYTLKRVFLSKAEEQGYYYGFSNEGLWPLCHIAYTRPIFRTEDWAQYKNVNEKFAQAALQELENVEEPCVLIQDYHFALLPRLLKEKRPDARIALFWHIPWPNPEAFGICPWQKEILEGLLGADVVGFHTQFHCNNFLETVDRTFEARLDWERFSVTKDRRSTLVKPFPISVSFPSAFQDINTVETAPRDPQEVVKSLGINSEFIGVGVERMDYTKGVMERFRSIERFFEKYPQYLGRFTFVQLGEPSRTSIKRYTDLLSDAQAKVDSINSRFKNGSWKPIVYIQKHSSHQEILPFYKRADICMVTSLHDGMNLVAKEFVASREDETGVLILSRFAGASRELRDALIVNPYDTEQMADAIAVALEMSAEEKSARMRRMREVVREHNIYRWAGNLIEELTRVRIENVHVPKTEDHALPVGS